MATRAILDKNNIKPYRCLGQGKELESDSSAKGTCRRLGVMYAGVTRSYEWLRCVEVITNSSRCNHKTVSHAKVQKGVQKGPKAKQKYAASGICTRVSSLGGKRVDYYSMAAMVEKEGQMSRRPDPQTLNFQTLRGGQSDAAVNRLRHHGRKRAEQARSSTSRFLEGRLAIRAYEALMCVPGCLGALGAAMFRIFCCSEAVRLSVCPFVRLFVSAVARLASDMYLF